MKKQIEGLDRVLAFVERYRDMAITSTGAKVVNFSGGLYNVKGSTPDPKRVPGQENEAWKQLLISYGIDANCYVTSDFLHGLVVRRMATTCCSSVAATACRCIASGRSTCRARLPEPFSFC